MTRLLVAARTPRRADGSFDRRLIGPMILGSILNPTNSSMLAVALVPIGHSFHVFPAQTAWLVSGLYLATAVVYRARTRCISRELEFDRTGA